MQSSHSESLLPWDNKELKVRGSIQALLNQRYLRSRAWLEKSQKFIYDIAPNLPGDRFRQFFRVSIRNYGSQITMILGGVFKLPR